MYLWAGAVWLVVDHPHPLCSGICSFRLTSACLRVRCGLKEAQVSRGAGIQQMLSDACHGMITVVLGVLGWSVTGSSQYEIKLASRLYTWLCFWPHPNATQAPVDILYVRHMSESICQILTPLEIRTSFGPLLCSDVVSRVCICWGITALQPHCILRQAMVNLNERIPLQQWVGMVYCIPCGTCSKVCVGEIGSEVWTRD